MGNNEDEFDEIMIEDDIIKKAIDEVLRGTVDVGVNTVGYRTENVEKRDVAVETGVRLPLFAEITYNVTGMYLYK